MLCEKPTGETQPNATNSNEILFTQTHKLLELPLKTCNQFNNKSKMPLKLNYERCSGHQSPFPFTQLNIEHMYVILLILKHVLACFVVIK